MPLFTPFETTKIVKIKAMKKKNILPKRSLPTNPSNIALALSISFGKAKSEIKIYLKTNKLVKISVEINEKFNRKIIKTQIIETIFYWHTIYDYKPSKTNYTLIEKSKS